MINKMVWVDIETTGLEEELFAIPLELGITVTDLEGNIEATRKSLVYDVAWRKHLADARPFVQEMHKKNNLESDMLGLEKSLLDENLNSTDIEKLHGAPTVDEYFVRWLTKHRMLEPDVYPMAGSTINFDRFFLRKFFPKTEAFFHYRNIDVSTLKLLCRMLNPELAARLVKPGDKTHRVLEDIEQSIHEYQFYRQEFLIWE